MATHFGSFTLPTPSKTSHLTNDAQFMSLHEYVLDSNSLSGNDTLRITNIDAGVIINRIELSITSPFVIPEAEQTNISIHGATESIILMDSTWNDPSTVGKYTTDCNYVMTSNLLVKHDLANMTSGTAILRIYAHDVVAE